jgi:FlgD Ig-like domain
VSRLSAAAFAALLLATVAAFFVTQHLKVKNPLINGDPRPDPRWIDPLAGGTCRDRAGDEVSFKRTRLSFFLQHRADNVLVYVVNSDGEIVDTVSSGRHMRVGVRGRDFVWDGRSGDGHGAVVADGTYYFKIVLQREGREFVLTGNPIHVLTARPTPSITGVQVTDGPASGSNPAIISPPGQSVTIHFSDGLDRGAAGRGPGRGAVVEIYRTDASGKPRLVKSFGVDPRRGVAVWDGTIGGAPAPAGTYLVGIRVTDSACVAGSFPVAIPPAPGSTPHAGVTVRYLAAEPPLTPVGAGATATVLVDSRRHGYRWALRLARHRQVLEHGRVDSQEAAAGQGVQLPVEIPGLGAQLYELALRSGAHRNVVPLVAKARGRRAATRVLVVVPALSWQGANPVDDDGSGLPDTLAAGDRIDVARPLVAGLPAGYEQEAALLDYLNREHLPYQLTTDLALAEGVGPALEGHSGVILDGSLTWLPLRLKGLLVRFAHDGGRVLSLGVSSMLRATPITGSGAGASAGPPQPAAGADPFGARPGAVVTGNREQILTITDRLGLFETSGLFAGFTTYQTIAPPSGAVTSLAGTADGTPSITGFRFGRGTVVEVGLPGFVPSLRSDLDSQELIQRLWQLLSS